MDLARGAASNVEHELVRLDLLEEQEVTDETLQPRGIVADVLEVEAPLLPRKHPSSPGSSKSSV